MQAEFDLVSYNKSYIFKLPVPIVLNLFLYHKKLVWISFLLYEYYHYKTHDCII